MVFHHMFSASFERYILFKIPLIALMEYDEHVCTIG
jgi:hypothetical protein